MQGFLNELSLPVWIGDDVVILYENKAWIIQDAAHGGIEKKIMSSNGFDIVTVFNNKGYILNYCEKLFEKNNYKEKTLFKDMPERMVFETEIWMVGAA